MKIMRLRHRRLGLLRLFPLMKGSSNYSKDLRLLTGGRCDVYVESLPRVRQLEIHNQVPSL